MAIITEYHSEIQTVHIPVTKKIFNKKQTIQTLHETDISTIHTFEELNTLFTNTINQNTKTIQINRKWKPKPRWNDEIRRLWIIKEYKQSLFNLFRNPYTAIELRKLNNRLKNTIRKYKKISWDRS